MAKGAGGGISDLTRASLRRHEDAYALYVQQRYRGAMYVAGYAVECLLKAKLMTMFGCYTLRELEDRLRGMGRLAASASLYTHALEPLLQFTGRAHVLKQDQRLHLRFALVNRWVPAWRYEPLNGDSSDAKLFLEAVDVILDWVRNNV